MYKYQNNAFRILGLLPSASTQEIISRVGEIRVKKSLGFEMAYEFDFLWMGPLDRSEENVINALQRLEDPVARIKEEIFWFWLESEEDKRALDCLKSNKRQAAHEIWRSIAYNSNIQSSNSDSPVKEPSEESIAACLNDAILAHSSIIARERNIRYQQDELKENSVVLDESHWKTWKFALNKLCSLDKLDGYWKKVNGKARRINDARLSATKINEIKGNFLSEILDVNFLFISQALASKDYERVKKHSSLISGINLPTHILRQGLNRALASQIDSLNQHCRSVSEEIAKLPKGMSIKNVLDIHSRFFSKIKKQINEGNLVDINCISDFALSRDNVATELRNIANMVNNEFSNYKAAFAIIKEAVEYAASSYVKERFQKDEAVISKNLAFQSNVTNIGRKTYPVSDKKVSIKKLFQDPFSISNWKNFILCWKSVLIWAGIIIFLVISSSSNSNKTSGTPSYSNSSSSSEISSLKEEISSGKTKLTELEVYINSGSEKLKAMKDEIDRLDAKYKYANYVPTNITQYYNSKIDEYNSLRETYNRVYDEYENLRNEYNAKVNKYNELIKR